jgi:TM2 domain-containing membrane protein YozV
MSFIRLTCPSCGRTLQIEEDALGQDVECGACSEVFVAATSENSSGKPTSVSTRPTAKPKVKERPKKRPSRRKREVADYPVYDDDDFDPTPTRERGDYRPSDQKSRIAYILLGVFLGLLGIHNFYAGRTGSGVAQLLITLISIPLMFFCIGFVTIFVPVVWVLVEMIVVDEDGNNVPMVW